MILANGEQYETSMQDVILSGLEKKLNATLAGPRLEPEIVIAAAEELGRRVEAGMFDESIAQLQVDGAESYKQMALRFLRREYLDFKLRTEL